MSTKGILLTENIFVNKNSHILYVYDTLEKYLAKTVSFILTTIENGEEVIYIDNVQRRNMVKNRLVNFLSNHQLSFVHFIDSHEFYGVGFDFDFQYVINNFQEVTRPLLEKQTPFRIWGHIDWKEDPNILEKLNTYECECNITLSEIGILTVCVYNGSTTPAKIQNNVMKYHDYLMTDNDVYRSVLNNKLRFEAEFPSQTVETLENEIDLYKQKLDFIHVISHEVRNPLTVIKGYAAILKSGEDNENKKMLLDMINDYVDVIDNEISHIICTEQMLCTSELWKSKIINPMQLLDEVIEIMKSKARSQNIQLSCNILLNGNELLKSNNIGFKLIISNLLSNAIKYSPEGGKVFLNAIIRDKELFIEIIDNGVGISKENQRKLFNKYEKIDTEKQGHGIGLYMVKKLVDHFHSKIDIKSQIDQGTTVSLQFPLLEYAHKKLEEYV